jgi:hypothetical protein
MTRVQAWPYPGLRGSGVSKLQWLDRRHLPHVGTVTLVLRVGVCVTSHSQIVQRDPTDREKERERERERERVREREN